MPIVQLESIGRALVLRKLKFEHDYINWTSLQVRVVTTHGFGQWSSEQFVPGEELCYASGYFIERSG